MIDLRSDTVTKPTAAMLEAMMAAEVGDDVFDDDPSVNELQAKVAQLFGMEAALYCPSGTMTNQIALRINTEPQDEVICDKRSHIYLYEGGGLAYNSMLSPKLLDGNRGRITAEMVAKNINPDDIHFPVSKLVSLENTMNKGGGATYDFLEIQKIREVCDQNGLKLHLDGARLFNALIATGQTPQQYRSVFDTISVCFSKGLGAPVGSLLLSTKNNIKKAKRVRKVFGGGMRQAGYLAAACIYALDNHVERLADDHQRASIIASELLGKPFIKNILPVETNIVIAELEGIEPSAYLERLKAHNILAVAFGAEAIRFVTHLDFDDDDLELTKTALNKLY
ncbi:MAG: GntG family PLP-dependent aldolase [Cyclobacteriaceae bacterium]